MPGSKARKAKTRTASQPGKRARTPPAPDPFDPKFVSRMLPFLRALRGYARLRVDGLENVPKSGPAILAANHTGWLGLDYSFAALVLHDELGRTPRGLVHDAWFMAPATAEFAGKVGLLKVSKPMLRKAIKAGNLVLVFPEGERGAFRPASGYQTTEFARGFVRVAMATKCPVVPVAILGGEEANPVDRTIESYESLLKLRLPVPQNIWPRPVKWRMRFLPPVDFSDFKARDADDAEVVHGLAEDVRARVQAALDVLKTERGDPYR